MISLADDLPLVKFDGGRVVAFRRDWLLRSILRAAEHAGYREWWLADHVTESITTYLRLRCEENVVAVPRLEKAVQSVLQVIGYAEVATHFVPDPPIVEISLHEMALAAGSGFELSFFHLLARRLRSVGTEDVRHVELLGLFPCVKFLKSRRIWNHGCRALQEEIVHFVRQHLETLSPDREILFALS